MADTETLIVNFFAGPGTGKSTHTAQLFADLKKDGVNCEIAHEFAKDLTWEGRWNTLKFQPYVAGKQMHKINRLIGQVDVIICDAPYLLCAIYGDGEGYYKPAFDEFLVESFLRQNTFNIYLERNSRYHAYNPKGRNQTEQEAIYIDIQIESFLDDYKISYDPIPIQDDTDIRLFNMVKELLYGRTTTTV